MDAPQADVGTWWRRVVRFAIRGELPAVPEEIPSWAVAAPYRLWRVPVRHDGRTFADLVASVFPAGLGRLMPGRALYLLLLVGWPLIALLRSLARGRGALARWRLALAYPELSVTRPRSDVTDREAVWSRPDLAFAMYYAWCARAQRPAWLSLLDDPAQLAAACEAQAIPMPPPTLRAKLRSHKDLERLFGEGAPLVVLRVITTLDPRTREAHVSRCAVRFAKQGAVKPVLWAQVDRRTGRVLPGVTEETGSAWDGDALVRVDRLPDVEHGFPGTRLPWFDEARLIALVAHRRLALEAPSLGWDVALSASGPLLLDAHTWTTCHDHDPQDDAFSPGCKLLVRALRGPLVTSGVASATLPQSARVRTTRNAAKPSTRERVSSERVRKDGAPEPETEGRDDRADSA